MDPYKNKEVSESELTKTARPEMEFPGCNHKDKCLNQEQEGCNGCAADSKTLIREAILKEIRDERLRQNEKFGIQKHNSLEWIAPIGEEFGEAAKAATEWYFFDGSMDEIRKELIHLAAITVNAIESFDRNGPGMTQKAIHTLTGE